MFLIIGLGNPGSEYETTRHNVGFIIVDRIAEDLKAKSSLKFTAQLFEAGTGQDKIFLAKPWTFMNLSGKSVQQICNFYKITLDQILVIHDDLDLEPGRIKIKVGGGSGGHNGLKSIDQHIGQDYARLRVGIGKRGDASSYVLGRFSNIERELYDQVADFTAANIDLLQKREFENFMTKYALETKSK